MSLRNTVNILGEPINPATLDAQRDGSQQSQIVDASGVPYGSIETESGLALPVYQTDKPDSTSINFHVENLSEGVYPFVLIDISDTVNYKHTLTTYAHLQLREFDIVCDVNGSWDLFFGFIENVSVSGSDFYISRNWSGSKSVDNTLKSMLNMFPIGDALRSGQITTYSSALNDNFKSNVEVPSTTSPSSPNVLPESGDVVCVLNVTDGNVLKCSSKLGYHSH